MVTYLRDSYKFKLLNGLCIFCAKININEDKTLKGFRAFMSY